MDFSFIGYDTISLGPRRSDINFLRKLKEAVWIYDLRRGTNTDFSIRDIFMII